MASYADSSASFKHRAKEVRLTDRNLQALEHQDIQSFNSLAYAICAQPGTIDDGRFQQLMDSIFGDAPTIRAQSSLRQLGYEVLTVAVAAIKQRVEPADELRPRKLPAQEREERKRAQQSRLSGLPTR